MQPLRDSLGNGERAVLDLDVLVEVRDAVNPVFDLMSVVVQHRTVGRPAVVVEVKPHADDLVWREESICYALLEGIGIDRVAEVFEVIAVFFGTRRRGHAHMDCAVEVIKYLAPG